MVPGEKMPASTLSLRQANVQLLEAVHPWVKASSGVTSGFQSQHC